MDSGEQLDELAKDDLEQYKVFRSLFESKWMEMMPNTWSWEMSKIKAAYNGQYEHLKRVNEPNFNLINCAVK